MSLFKISISFFLIVCLPFKAYSKLFPAPAPPTHPSCEDSFKDPDSFALAMTEGLRLSREQIDLFTLYRNIYFGDSKKYITKGLDDVIKILERHPELSKLPVREQHIIFEEKNHEIPQSLSDFVRNFRNSAIRIRSNLFQIHENLSFWRKMLDFPKLAIDPSLSKKEQKSARKKDNEIFLEYLNQFINKDTLESLKSPVRDNELNELKVIFLYRILKRIREDMLANGKDIRAISQAMVDLVHGFGFGNTFYTSLLRSTNPKEQLAGVIKILDARDSMALTLGFEDHFSELMRSLNVDHPTGSTKKENLDKILRNIEKDIESMPYNTYTQTSVLRVRALSLLESPFRSYLCESDCSSSHYFEKALDPNFLYFTITDSNHRSSGHITVVLGTAENIKIAFVDKIQHVPNDRILPMLESIRLSLREQGYKLGLPKDMGGHNGLSNTGIIRDYVQSEINSKLETSFSGFKPHEHQYSFNNGYSRAYSEPELWEFKPLENMDVKIEPGEIKQPQNAPENLNVESLYREVLSLQHSENEEDQITFINNLIGLSEVEGLSLSYSSSNFLSRYFRRFRRKASNDNFADGYLTQKIFVYDYLTQKISDPKTSFKVRKLALWTLMEFLHERYDIFIHEEIYKKSGIPVTAFLKSWDKFSTKEQDILFGEVSNWRHSKTPWKSELFKKLSKKFTEDIYHVRNIQYILEHRLASLFINMTRGYVINALLTAAKKGDLESLHFLLEKDVDVNSRGFHNRTALISAAAKGQTEAVDFLLKRDANIHDYDSDKKTALIIAADNGHTETVDLLIETFDDKNKALIAAATNGHTETVDLLIRRGADVNYTTPYIEEKILMQAENEGYRLYSEDTALTISARNGHTKTVKRLIERGADISHVSYFYSQYYGGLRGITALGWASKKTQ